MAEPNHIDEHPVPTSGLGTWKQVFIGRLGIYTLVLNLAVALFAIDTFVISTIMPTVVGDIGGTRYYSWTVMLYMVGSIIGASSAGPVKELFGRRNGYAIAGLLFVVGNAGAGLAPNMIILVLWRLIQGLGGGLIISQSYGLVGDMYPPELRVRILSLISTTWGVATLVGPGFGGVFAEFGVWRAAFWAIVPLGLMFVALAWHFIPTSIGDPTKTKFLSNLPIYRLASLGGSILCVGLTSQVEEEIVSGALLFGALGLAVFAFRWDTQSSNPMFPSNTLVIHTEIGSAYWIILLVTMSFCFATIYVTLYLQVLHDQPPIVAAYIHALMSLSWTASALVVASWHGRAIWWSIFGGVVLILVGVVILALWATSSLTFMPAIGLILVGLGMGLSNNHIIALAILAAPKGQEALAGSSVQTMRTLGIGFGAAGAGYFANAAGLAGAGIEANAIGEIKSADLGAVVAAIDWVHRGDILLAALALLVTIIFFSHARQRTR